MKAWLLCQFERPWKGGEGMGEGKGEGRREEEKGESERGGV